MDVNVVHPVEKPSVEKQSVALASALPNASPRKYSSVIISYLLLLMVLAFGTILGGCADNKSANTINLGDNDGSVAVPNSIKTVTINSSGISAYITLDNGIDAPMREPMSIDSNNAEFAISGLLPGTYTITIEYEFSDINFSNIKLTVGAKTGVVLGAGISTNIAFLQNDYSFPDDDNDGVFNIIELEEGTNPIDIDDTPNLTCSADAGVIECLPTQYQIGGSVLGLKSTLVLQNNGIDDLAIIAVGAFKFPTKINNGNNFLVTVSTQPSSPTQDCVVDNGSGQVNGTDITGIVINCTTDSFTVGGTVSGLAGDGLTLKLDNNNVISISANGKYSFPTLISSGTNYQVSIISQPTALNQTCTLENANSNVNNTNVTDVNVSCVTETYNVGGSILGLLGTLVLHNNDTDNLTISQQDGPFKFATKLDDGSDYLATVFSQPTDPVQNCVISNDSGKISGMDINGININCTTNSFTVGGMVSGLAGNGLTLDLNGTTVTINKGSTSYTFATLINSGIDYAVSITKQPNNLKQTCSLANKSGTIGNINISNVNVNCVTNTYSVGGEVFGLAGTLELQNNGIDDQTITGAGTFTFTTVLLDGDNFDATVSVQPVNPVQNCVVANGKGKVNGADITGVIINCTTNTYTVGGTISGLAGDGLTVQLKDATASTILSEVIITQGNMTYSFQVLVNSGTSYTVAVLNQPTNLNQICTLMNDTGTINNTDVTDVNINCATDSFTVGGTITSLEGDGMELLNNDADPTSVLFGINDFTFSPQLDGSGYSVSVLTQPSIPAQICEMTSNVGTVDGANVLTVAGCCKRADSLLVVNTTTVFDPTTGLTWQRDWEPDDYNWTQAVDRCAIQGLRLPTQVELESIVDARFTPTWMSCTFNGTGLSGWTSTSVGNQSAFIVHFSSGGTGNDVKRNRYSARCVTGP